MPSKPRKRQTKRAGAKSKKKLDPRPQASALSASDESALALFCESTNLDDVSLDSWESSHSDLDLTVPIWLAKDQTIQGGERLIDFTRSIRSTQDAAIVREKTSCLVRVPPGVESGVRLTVTGEGDRLGSRSGNLVVVVYVKK